MRSHYFVDRFIDRIKIRYENKAAFCARPGPAQCPFLFLRIIAIIFQYAIIGYYSGL